MRAAVSRMIRRAYDPQSRRYLVWATKQYFDRSAWVCPNCGSKEHSTVSRKLLVTALRRCQNCLLLYRCPRDDQSALAEFYQEDYASGGLTTSPPDERTLDQMLQSRFKGTDKNFSEKINLLGQLGISRGARVLDYGASWGYGTRQLRDAGYDATGYEISVARARFGQQYLDIRIVSDPASLDDGFDAVFSSHVLEHFANPCEALSHIIGLLRTGGLVIAFTPNGSLARLPADRKAYNVNWGRLHPVYPDDAFYQVALPKLPKLLVSSRNGLWNIADLVGRWDRRSDLIGDLTGSELLLVAIKQ